MKLSKLWLAAIVAGSALALAAPAGAHDSWRGGRSFGAHVHGGRVHLGHVHPGHVHGGHRHHGHGHGGRVHLGAPYRTVGPGYQRFGTEYRPYGPSPWNAWGGDGRYHWSGRVGGSRWNGRDDDCRDGRRPSRDFSHRRWR